MKKLLFLLFLFPLIASAQLDFETNKFKLDFVKLPEIESLMTTSLPVDASFGTKSLKRLPSFNMNKENYRQPVSMFDAMAANETYIKSDIKISLDPKEYGIYTGNSRFTADGATSVKNIAYKDADAYLRPGLMPHSYGFYQRPQRRSGFYVGYGVYGTPSQ